MQIFMANKGMMMNVSLSEIKSMKPEEMYMLFEEMQQISKEMEKAKNNGI